MPRIIRNASKGSMLHVIIRSISQRGIFTCDAESKYFISLLARLVRKERILVVSFSLMTNHAHLVIVCLDNDISGSIQFLANSFSRWFNKRHGRTGPLYRNRFHSKVVDSEEYLRALIRYIDHNPVSAGMCQSPEDHRFGSARAWHTGRFPLWLNQSRIIELLKPHTHCRSAQEAYRGLFGRPPSTNERDWIDSQRLAHQAKKSEVNFKRWFDEKAKLADGTLPQASRISASKVIEELQPSHEFNDPLLDKIIGKTKTRDLFLIAALRDLAGRPVRVIGAHLGISRQAVGRRLTRHQELLESSPSYSDLYFAVTQRITATG